MKPVGSAATALAQYGAIVLRLICEDSLQDVRSIEFYDIGVDTKSHTNFVVLVPC